MFKKADSLNTLNDERVILLYKNELCWYKFLGAEVNLLYDGNIVVISNSFIKGSDSNLIDLWLNDNIIKINSFDYEKELKGALDIFDNLKISNFTIRRLSDNPHKFIKNSSIFQEFQDILEKI